LEFFAFVTLNCSLTCNGKNFAMPFACPLPVSSEFFFAEAVPLTGKKNIDFLNPG
jgi:hypothetical protein